MERKDYKEAEFVSSQNRSTTEILKAKGLLSEINNKNITNDEEQNAWNKTVKEEQEKWDAIIRLDDPLSKDLLKNVTFEELFLSLESNESLYEIKIGAQTSFCTKFLQLLFGPRPLVKSLEKERDLIFNITKLSIENDNTLHCRILQTIYKKLTKSKRNSPRFGSHWEDIGFQGDDPATDLRGAGFLALLHLLFLLTYHLPLAHKIFKMSLDPVQNFPFCLMSINMTRISLQALMDNKLSKMCNRRKEVVSVINEFYLAVFLYLYQIWKNEHKTMLDSGHVINDVEIYAFKHPVKLLKSLPKLLKKSHHDQTCTESYKFTLAALTSSTTNKLVIPNKTMKQYLTAIKPYNEQISTLEFEGIVED